MSVKLITFQTFDVKFQTQSNFIQSILFVILTFKDAICNSIYIYCNLMLFGAAAHSLCQSINATFLDSIPTREYVNIFPLSSTTQQARKQEWSVLTLGPSLCLPCYKQVRCEAEEMYYLLVWFLICDFLYHFAIYMYF